MDRDPLQRGGAVFGAPPGCPFPVRETSCSPLLLGPDSPGKPHSTGPQPRSELGLAQDGRDGAMG
jgi:hypothetical protein